jgi:hypothetical protein
MDPLRRKVSLIATDNMYIQNSVGTPLITFTTGFGYYNLASLYSIPDYIDVRSDFDIVKLKSVTFEIIRVADEATIRDS